MWREARSLSEGACFTLSGSLHGCQALLIFGGMAQSAGLPSVLMLLMLLFGLVHQASWWSCVAFLVDDLGASGCDAGIHNVFVHSVTRASQCPATSH